MSEHKLEALVSQLTRPYVQPEWQGAYPKIWIDQLSSEWTNKKVHLRGRVAEMRDQKKFIFLTLQQGDIDRVTVVVDKAQTRMMSSTRDEKDKDGTLKPSVQSWVHIDGEVKALPPGKHNRYLPLEIQAETLDIRSQAKEDYLSRCPKNADISVQLEQRHLSIRDQTFAIEQELCQQFVECLERHMIESGCSRVSPPSFTSMPCEGGADIIKLKVPGVSKEKPLDVGLVQSSQLYLEFSINSRGKAGVFCNAKSWRGEHSHTRRHLVEFDHFEAEWNDVTTIDEHAEKLISMLKGSISKWLVVGERRLRYLGKYDAAVNKLKMLDDVVFLHHRDAIKMLNALGIKNQIKIESKEPSQPAKIEECEFKDTDDIAEAQERKLIDTIGKIVLLHGFSKSFKSFYMARNPSDPERVLGIDVEVPGVGEIIGSGIRASTVKDLKIGLEEQGLSDKEYGCYFDTREYGFPFTSGMGLGVGRLMTWLLDQDSIRRVTEYPRFPAYAAP